MLASLRAQTLLRAASRKALSSVPLPTKLGRAAPLGHRRLCTSAPDETVSRMPRVQATLTPDGTAMATQLVEYINESWTPWHAVAEASKRLLAAGFEHISETAEWSLKPGGRYFFTRNMSTVVAFAVGEKYAPGNGFYMVGAHTDSPCLKLKPVSKSSKAGCLTVNVETYGGGLWYTWFDRDLSVAGATPDL